MTAPEQRPAPVGPGEIAAYFAIDTKDPANPSVLMRISNGAITTDYRIDARSAEQFGQILGGGLINSARQALAAAGPQLATPPGDGGLWTPGS